MRIFTEGFETQQLGGFTEVYGFGITTGRFNGYALGRFAGDPSLKLPLSVNEFYLRFAYITAARKAPRLRLIDTNNFKLAEWRWELNGLFEYVRAEEVNPIAFSTARVKSDWTVIELHYRLGNANGIVQMRQDGVLVMDYTGRTSFDGAGDVAWLQWTGDGGTGFTIRGAK